MTANQSPEVPNTTVTILPRSPDGRPDGSTLSPLRTIPPADRHPVSVYLASLGAGSRRTMLAALENIAAIASTGEAGARTLPWHELRYQHSQAIRSVLATRYKPATANKTLSALRGVLKECWRLGYTTAEDYHRARDIQPVRGSTLPKGREIKSGERTALFDAFASDKKPARGARDAALVAVLYGCGLRRAEAVGLDLSDVEPDSGEVRVRSAKGNKERLVYAPVGALAAINDWVSNHRGTAPGPLLRPVLKNGKVVEERLSPQTVYDVLRRRAAEISTVKSLSPHDFRRTFVGDIIDAKGDLSVAQQLAGHSSPETTARYDRRGERVKKAASEGLHVPYHKNPDTPNILESDENEAE